MATEIYLGMPPAHIKRWIETHTSSEECDPVDTSHYGQIVAALENCLTSDFDMTNLTYTGTNPVLTALGVGQKDTSKYQIKTGETPIDMSWVNLGFNGSIPEYVKYRKAVGSGYKHIWVKSMKNGILAAIDVGDKTYTRTYKSETLGYDYTEDSTITAKSGSFSYGNLNPYAVPTKITTSDGEYDFCGYNITLNSEFVLVDMDPYVNNDPTEIHGVYFDGESGNCNRYSESEVRKYLNDKDAIVDGYYDDLNNDDDDGNQYGRYDCKSFISKVDDEQFLKNIVTTVNKTWVHPDWNSGAETVDHVVDKFWLLGNGNINYSEDWLKDRSYDTSKFTSVYQDDDSVRVRNLMNATGGDIGTPCYWWLRSADSYSSDYVGYVYYDGHVDDDTAYSCYGVLPACTIG